MHERGPAYRIETDRLVIRCWDPADAALMDEAVGRSRESLVPWLPWAAKERKHAETVATLRRFRSNFDRDDDYVYAILDPDEVEVVGGTGLHRRVGPDGLEIGYWIDVRHQGRGLATEATRALVKTGFELFDIVRIDIRCDEHNAASRRVVEKVGFTYEGTLRSRMRDAEGKARNHRAYSMLREEYERSTIRQAQVRWYDAAGSVFEPTPEPERPSAHS